VQIDWITVAAQIANFLVLVWLLQRFLYRPITRAMARREEEIEKRLAEAKEARKDAEDEAETLRGKQSDLEDEKDQILDDARQEAQSLRERLEEDIREDMEVRRETWRSHLEEERAGFASTLQRRAGHQVIAITEQMLHEYARADLAGELANGFIARLENLEDERRDKLSQAASHSHDPAVVESSITLKSGVRGKITRAVHEVLKTDIDIDYRQNEDLVLGVRLTIGEQTLEWSAARHLKRLEGALDEAIDNAASKQPTASEVKAGSP
jgi:F-type H+-transporting ATPase subunit b